MATVTEPPRVRKHPVKMTLAEFQALPEVEGVTRELIRGYLWEDDTVPRHNRHHARTMTRVATALENWLQRQPVPRGAVFTGDAGVILPDDNFGIDVAYVSAAVMARQNDAVSSQVVGVPDLAVEIISPGEVVERLDDKTDALLAAGVKLVWELRPRRQTVTALRDGQPHVAFSGTQDVTADDVLPGFRVPACDLFG